MTSTTQYRKATSSEAHPSRPWWNKSPSLITWARSLLLKRQSIIRVPWTQMLSRNASRGLLREFIKVCGARILTGTANLFWGHRTFCKGSYVYRAEFCAYCWFSCMPATYHPLKLEDPTTKCALWATIPTPLALELPPSLQQRAGPRAGSPSTHPAACWSAGTSSQPSGHPAK